MATLVSYDLNGKKLSFANWISNLSSSDTPFVSMTGKESVNQTLFQWQSDSLSPANVDNAHEEGSTAIDDSLTTTVTRNNYTQILRKVVKVSDTANALANYGRGRELQYQMEKAGKEIKRDLELILLSAQEKDAGVPYSVPRRTAGFRSLVAAPNEVDPDTGAVVHFSIMGDSIVEGDLWNLTYNLYISGSQADIIMFHPKHAKFFAGLMETTDGTRVRMFDGTKDNKVSLYVTEIVDPLGNTYKLVPNGSMPEDAIYFFNPKDWTQMVLRAPERTQLAKDGSYEKWMIEMEVGLRHRNPYASGVLLLSDSDPTEPTKLSIDKTSATIGLGGASIGQLVNKSDGSVVISATHEDGSTVSAISSDTSIVTVNPVAATGRSRAARAAVANQFTVEAKGVGSATISFTDGTDTVTSAITVVESFIDIDAIPDMYPGQKRVVSVTGAVSDYTLASTNTANVIVFDAPSHTIQCLDAHDATITATETISGIQFYGSAYVTCDNIHMKYNGASTGEISLAAGSTTSIDDKVTATIGDSSTLVGDNSFYLSLSDIKDGKLKFSVTNQLVLAADAVVGTTYDVAINTNIPREGGNPVPATLKVTVVDGGGD